MSKRKRHHPEPKAKLELDSMKSGETVSELASRFGMHPTMTHQWKRALQRGRIGVLERGGRNRGISTFFSGAGSLQARERGAGWGGKKPSPLQKPKII